MRRRDGAARHTVLDDWIEELSIFLEQHLYPPWVLEISRMGPIWLAYQYGSRTERRVHSSDLPRDKTEGLGSGMRWRCVGIGATRVRILVVRDDLWQWRF
jgi:hypothetical protein